MKLVTVYNQVLLNGNSRQIAVSVCLHCTWNSELDVFLRSGFCTPTVDMIHTRGQFFCLLSWDTSGNVPLFSSSLSWWCGNYHCVVSDGPQQLPLPHEQASSEYNLRPFGCCRGVSFYYLIVWARKEVDSVVASSSILYSSEARVQTYLCNLHKDYYITVWQTTNIFLCVLCTLLPTRQHLHHPVLHYSVK
jgi:hypothetical protein